MNTDTGRIYNVREGLVEEYVNPTVASLAAVAGEDAEQQARNRFAIMESQLRRMGAGDLTDDEQALLRDAAAGAPIVPVSAHVAQAVKLGERELERRAKRRKAAKEARKRNR